ncbi:hypothetical protein K491DRAFT_101421 [Lophiostoma macrostomum CBS 122681]|uniref:Uncharacterized protein n=1 Tax=Lophiostoma macrostomum CBS 122681 TaxID=1314788 RepID=A0A6A6SU17_9PLEO|nr:hypothetical protein K491DRAFT_101421 [Lophiostoma macrostomum CBS 122681]
MKHVSLPSSDSHQSTPFIFINEGMDQQQSKPALQQPKGASNDPDDSDKEPILPQHERLISITSERYQIQKTDASNDTPSYFTRTERLRSGLLAVTTTLHSSSDEAPAITLTSETTRSQWREHARQQSKINLLTHNRLGWSRHRVAVPESIPDMDSSAAEAVEIVPMHEKTISSGNLELDAFFNELKEEYEVKTGRDWVPRTPTIDMDWDWNWGEDEEEDNGDDGDDGDEEDEDRYAG